MSTWRERMAAKMAAKEAAAPARRGVRFIGDATGDTNVAKSPTRKASPHHRNRNVTRRALRATAPVSPAGSPPQRPGKGALAFRRAAVRRPKSKKAHHKGRKATRKHTRRYHKK